ncbi:MAG: proton-conducting transporter membrane subunit, partial [Bryocella sp.]
HFWAPDAYEAAPAPAAGFIASSSKVASFFIFFQIMTLAFAGAEGSAAGRHFAIGWVPVIAIVSALSMVLGNLVALRQTSVRRLIAYSAIAQGGYMLIAFVTHTPESLAAMLYYVATYALATIGIFAIIGVVESNSGSDHFNSFNGLSRRAPLLATSLFVFFLSLAGIPPLSGFFGKFYIFLAAISTTPSKATLLWLVVLAFAASAVSLYYYLQVLKHALVTDPTPDAPAFHVPALTQLLVALLALAIILLGCAPHLFLHWIQLAIAS